MLTKNIWHFAAAKNYSELKQLSNALLDNEGNVRSFADFKYEATKIITNFNKNWLETEYNHAIAVSQMATKWQNFTANGSDPILEYDAILDNGTTQLCRGLDKTRLKSSHPFWQQFYPPNHWACRSTVRVLNNATETPESQIGYAEIPKAFRTNFVTQQVVFPKDHPYFIDMPLEVLSYANISYKQSIYQLPLADQYETLFTSKTNNGSVRAHKLFLPKPNKKDDDFQDIIYASKIIAEQLEKNIDILPEIYSKEVVARRKILKGYNNYSKNPDLFFDGQYYDIKRPNKNNIITNMNKAIDKQDAIPIIILPNLSENEVLFVKNKILEYKNDKKHQYFDKAIFINDGKIVPL